jgi:hypothetical protein
MRYVALMGIVVIVYALQHIFPGVPGFIGLGVGLGYIVGSYYGRKDC